MAPAASIVAASAIFCTPAYADLDDLLFQNPIEAAAASANQATYNMLTGGPTPTCQQDITVPTGACTGNVFVNFERVRELVETANGLTPGNQGSTRYSLFLDQENLGFALRWTAAEELAAQGSSATQFSNNQLNSLASRISALRFAARRASGGGASADSEGIASRWGAFIDGSFGYGRKDDTSDPFVESGTNGNEDAFDFDGQEVTLGVDYRLSDAAVVGALVGYTERTIDFDSTVSIVDGGIDVEGESLMLFGMWDSDRFYLSGSIGGQWLQYDLTRNITYPSLNPLIASIDVTKHSDTDSTAITATFGAGFTYNVSAFGIELYVNGDYQDIKVDGFSEGGSEGFEFQYGSQDIKSFDVAAGMELEYVLGTRFGVVVPYLRGEFHRELENDQRSISAVYAALPGGSKGGMEDFGLKTDNPDDEYLLAAAGFSVVLPGGLQGYLQYQKVFDLDTFDDQAITGGFRFEF
jgi:uncharacterized protein YhjY with autotransporter beta-barrel domain